jgi:hypothetical protein
MPVLRLPDRHHHMLKGVKPRTFEANQTGAPNASDTISSTLPAPRRGVIVSVFGLDGHRGRAWSGSLESAQHDAAKALR